MYLIPCSRETNSQKDEGFRSTFVGMKKGTNSMSLILLLVLLLCNLGSHSRSPLYLPRKPFITSSDPFGREFSAIHYNSFVAKSRSSITNTGDGTSAHTEKAESIADTSSLPEQS